MAHFYGSMTGARGETTRTGTKSSGISAHVRSYSHGIRADMNYSPGDQGSDRAFIEITSGSNGGPTSHIYLDASELDAILEGRAVLAVVPVDADEGSKDEGVQI